MWFQSGHMKAPGKLGADWPWQPKPEHEKPWLKRPCNFLHVEKMKERRIKMQRALRRRTRMMQTGKRLSERMPIGEHKGVPVVDLPTSYLLWGLSNANFRINYPQVREQMLKTLASRLADNLEAVRTELSTPPITWGMSKGELLNYKRQQRLRKAARDKANRLEAQARKLGVEDLF